VDATDRLRSDDPGPAPGSGGLPAAPTATAVPAEAEAPGPPPSPAAGRVTSFLARLVDGAAVGGALGVLLSFYRPSLLLARTTTTGGDMGAHLYGPWYLKTVLLPRGLLFGWSPDWFAGFPIFQFYFPFVPTFQALLSYAIPYEVAFKLGTVLGPFFLPVAVYLLFRLVRLPFPAPAVGAVLTLAFQFMERANGELYSILGGNVPSSLAGEYSYALSLGLCLVFLGLAYRVATEDRGRPLLASVVLALAALSHLVPVMVVALFTPVLGFWAVRTHGVAGAARRLALVFGLAFALAAFWALPFLVNVRYTANMRWGPLEGWGWLFPREIRVYLVGAASGLVLALLTLDRRVLVWVVPAASAFALFWALPQGHLWNGRFLPFWYLGTVLTSAYLVGTAAHHLGEELAGVRALRPASVGLPVAVAVSVLGTVTSSLVGGRATLYSDDWIRWNYEGVEAKAPYPELRALFDRVRALPPGRVLWEPSPELNQFGTPVQLMALPYFAGHPSMEGIYFESSITTPFHFLTAAEVADRPSNPIPGLPYGAFNLRHGVRHMELFDVRYFIAWSEKAKEAASRSRSLRPLGEVGRFSLYELRRHAQVVVPRYWPVVLEGADWEDANLRWFADLSGLDVPMVREGPSDWPRARDPAALPRRPVEGGGVAVPARVTPFEIRFTTDAVGKPHWVRTSYHPNWRVEGAEGPYLASPSLMVVVPTRREVRLHYSRGWSEWAGLGLTVLALLAAAAPPTRRLLAAWGGR
jgi:hypothetical protein